MPTTFDLNIASLTAAGFTFGTDSDSGMNTMAASGVKLAEIESNIKTGRMGEHEANLHCLAASFMDKEDRDSIANAIHDFSTRKRNGAVVAMLLAGGIDLAEIANVTPSTLREMMAQDPEGGWLDGRKLTVPKQSGEIFSNDANCHFLHDEAIDAMLGRWAQLKAAGFSGSKAKDLFRKNPPSAEGQATAESVESTETPKARSREEQMADMESLIRQTIRRGLVDDSSEATVKWMRAIIRNEVATQAVEEATAAV